MTSDPTYQWKQVSDGNSDVYVLWNAPVRVQGRIFVFGQAESGVEAIAPIVEGEMVKGAGDGDGDRDGDNGGVDGTTSGSDIDSKRVEVALLTGDSQHMCQIQRTRDRNVPVSSVPPIYHAERLYGLVRCRC